MSDTKVVDRVRKLLALAQSSNVNEAATAALRARELMEQHRLEEGDIAISSGGAVPREDVVEEELQPRGGSRVLKWKTQLAAALAEAFNSQSIYLTGGSCI